MSRHDNRGGLGRYGVVPSTVVRQQARNPDGSVICPECGHDITDSKGTHPVISPDFVDEDLCREYEGELLVFGWRCTRHQYDVLAPSHCAGSDASNLADGWLGVRLTFADEQRRWVPTPARELSEQGFER